MRLPASRPVQRRALLKANRDAASTAEIDNLLNARSSGSFGDENAVNGAAGLQGFANGMDAGENAHEVDGTVDRVGVRGKGLRGQAIGFSMMDSVQSSAPHIVDSSTAKQDIPDKLYFRIGDVSRLAALKPSVLRYWETEFPAIAPKKSGSGQRLYRRKDVELILQIKHLLYEKRFTIEGARKAIEVPPAVSPAPKRQPKTIQANLFSAPGEDLSAIRQELEAILSLLK